MTGKCSHCPHPTGHHHSHGPALSSRQPSPGLSYSLDDVSEGREQGLGLVLYAVLGTQRLHQGRHFVVVVSGHRGEEASGRVGKSVASAPTCRTPPRALAETLLPGAPDSLVLDLEVEVPAEPVVEGGLVDVARCLELEEEVGGEHVSASEPRPAHHGQVRLARGQVRRPLVPPFTLQQERSLQLMRGLLGELIFCRYHPPPSSLVALRLGLPDDGPHLGGHPVHVPVVVDVHGDVVHLRDPHKPVALQEPGDAARTDGQSGAPAPSSSVAVPACALSWATS